jgi:hypothetical protein
MKKTAACLFVLAAMGLFAGPALAGLLDSGGIYNGWSGRSDFASTENPDLHGYVLWAVFAPDAFPFTDSTEGPAPNTYFTRTAGELTYAYQLFNDGPDNLSMEIVFMDNTADNIGAVTDTSLGLSGYIPTFMQLDAPGSAMWGFGGIPQGSSSEGLVYCSPNTPVMSDASITIDGGTYGIATVSVPSAVPIPEPAILWTLVISTLAGAATYLRRR